jgi:DNA mismatch repair protein MSH6
LLIYIFFYCVFNVIYFRGDGQYIPNDVQLGGKYTGPQLTQSSAPTMDHIPKLLLLTGPNMGGKSTLLRQTCLIVILAQLGCRVPAEECILSPADRIFTRVGASDRILAGQSTFFVELAETSLILKAATEDSLCILDELGRGTATFDGTAIAHSVVNHLVTHIGCRTLFATHYHLLIEDWELDPRVQLGHMDCLVNNVPLPMEPQSSSSSPSTGKKSNPDDNVVEEVTFLYKLCHGSSPKSYGINVAKLAGMPLELIQLAIQQSHAFEQSSKQSRNSSNTQRPGITSQETHEWYQKIARILRMYERVASIVHAPILNKSHGKLEEFVYLIQEIWRRYEVQCSH